MNVELAIDIVEFCCLCLNASEIYDNLRDLMLWCGFFNRCLRQDMVSFCLAIFVGAVMIDND